MNHFFAYSTSGLLTANESYRRLFFRTVHSSLFFPRSFVLSPDSIDRLTLLVKAKHKSHMLCQSSAEDFSPQITPELAEDPSSLPRHLQLFERLFLDDDFCLSHCATKEQRTAMHDVKITVEEVLQNPSIETSARDSFMNWYVEELVQLLPAQTSLSLRLSSPQSFLASFYLSNLWPLEHIIRQTHLVRFNQHFSARKMQFQRAIQWLATYREEGINIRLLPPKYQGLLDPMISTRRELVRSEILQTIRTQLKSGVYENPFLFMAKMEEIRTEQVYPDKAEQVHHIEIEQKEETMREREIRLVQKEDIEDYYYLPPHGPSQAADQHLLFTQEETIIEKRQEDGSIPSRENDSWHSSIDEVWYKDVEFDFVLLHLSEQRLFFSTQPLLMGLSYTWRNCVQVYFFWQSMMQEQADSSTHPMATIGLIRAALQRSYHVARCRSFSALQLAISLDWRSGLGRLAMQRASFWQDRQDLPILMRVLFHRVSILLDWLDIVLKDSLIFVRIFPVCKPKFLKWKKKIGPGIVNYHYWGTLRSNTEKLGQILFLSVLPLFLHLSCHLIQHLQTQQLNRVIPGIPTLVPRESCLQHLPKVQKKTALALRKPGLGREKKCLPSGHRAPLLQPALWGFMHMCSLETRAILAQYINEVGSSSELLQSWHSSHLDTRLSCLLNLSVSSHYPPLWKRSFLDRKQKSSLGFYLCLPFYRQTSLIHLAKPSSEARDLDLVNQRIQALVRLYLPKEYHSSLFFYLNTVSHRVDKRFSTLLAFLQDLRKSRLNRTSQETYAKGDWKDQGLLEDSTFLSASRDRENLAKVDPEIQYTDAVNLPFMNLLWKRETITQLLSLWGKQTDLIGYQDRGWHYWPSRLYKQIGTMLSINLLAKQATNSQPVWERYGRDRGSREEGSSLLPLWMQSIVDCQDCAVPVDRAKQKLNTLHTPPGRALLNDLSRIPREPQRLTSGIAKLFALSIFSPFLSLDPLYQAKVQSIHGNKKELHDLFVSRKTLTQAISRDLPVFSVPFGHSSTGLYNAPVNTGSLDLLDISEDWIAVLDEEIAEEYTWLHWLTEHSEDLSNDLFFLSDTSSNPWSTEQEEDQDGALASVSKTEASFPLSRVDGQQWGGKQSHTKSALSVLFALCSAKTLLTDYAQWFLNPPWWALLTKEIAPLVDRVHHQLMSSIQAWILSGTDRWLLSLPLKEIWQRHTLVLPSINHVLSQVFSLYPEKLLAEARRDSASLLNFRFIDSRSRLRPLFVLFFALLLCCLCSAPYIPACLGLKYWFLFWQWHTINAFRYPSKWKLLRIETELRIMKGYKGLILPKLKSYSIHTSLYRQYYSFWIRYRTIPKRFRSIDTKYYHRTSFQKSLMFPDQLVQETSALQLKMGYPEFISDCYERGSIQRMHDWSLNYHSPALYQCEHLMYTCYYWTAYHQLLTTLWGVPKVSKDAQFHPNYTYATYTTPGSTHPNSTKESWDSIKWKPNLSLERAWLFMGPENVGKMHLAKSLAANTNLSFVSISLEKLWRNSYPHPSIQSEVNLFCNSGLLPNLSDWSENLEYQWRPRGSQLLLDNFSTYERDAWEEKGTSLFTLFKRGDLWKLQLLLYLVQKISPAIVWISDLDTFTRDLFLYQQQSRVFSLCLRTVLDMITPQFKGYQTRNSMFIASSEHTRRLDPILVGKLRFNAFVSLKIPSPKQRENLVLGLIQTYGCPLRENLPMDEIISMTMGFRMPAISRLVHKACVLSYREYFRSRQRHPVDRAILLTATIDLQKTGPEIDKLEDGAIAAYKIGKALFQQAVNPRPLHSNGQKTKKMYSFLNQHYLELGEESTLSQSLVLPYIYSYIAGIAAHDVWFMFAKKTRCKTRLPWMRENKPQERVKDIALDVQTALSLFTAYCSELASLSLCERLIAPERCKPTFIPKVEWKTGRVLHLLGKVDLTLKHEPRSMQACITFPESLFGFTYACVRFLKDQENVFPLMSVHWVGNQIRERLDFYRHFLFEAQKHIAEITSAYTIAKYGTEEQFLSTYIYEYSEEDSLEEYYEYTHEFFHKTRDSDKQNLMNLHDEEDRTDARDEEDRTPNKDDLTPSLEDIRALRLLEKRKFLEKRLRKMRLKLSSNFFHREYLRCYRPGFFMNREWIPDPAPLHPRTITLQIRELIVERRFMSQLYLLQPKTWHLEDRYTLPTGCLVETEDDYFSQKTKEGEKGESETGNWPFWFIDEIKEEAKKKEREEKRKKMSNAMAALDRMNEALEIYKQEMIDEVQKNSSLHQHGLLEDNSLLRRPILWENALYTNNIRETRSIKSLYYDDNHLLESWTRLAVGRKNGRQYHQKEYQRESLLNKYFVQTYNELCVLFVNQGNILANWVHVLVQERILLPEDMQCSKAQIHCQGTNKGQELRDVLRARIDPLLQAPPWTDWVQILLREDLGSLE